MLYSSTICRSPRSRSRTWRVAEGVNGRLRLASELRIIRVATTLVFASNRSATFDKICLGCRESGASPGVTRSYESGKFRSDAGSNVAVEAMDSRIGAFRSRSRHGVCGDVSGEASFPLSYKIFDKSKTCDIHGEQSWEPARRAEATAREEAGKTPIASRTFACGLETADDRVTKFLVCDRCSKAMCFACTQTLAERLNKIENQRDTPYSKALRQLRDAKLPESESPSSTILLTIPGGIAHCCEWSLEKIATAEATVIHKESMAVSREPQTKDRKRRKQSRDKEKKKKQKLLLAASGDQAESHNLEADGPCEVVSPDIEMQGDEDYREMKPGLLRKIRKDRLNFERGPLPSPTGLIGNLTPVPAATGVAVDGVFGLVGYDVAIFPSLVYSDTLSLAQMGRKKSAGYQRAVSHSVIPNALASQYQRNNIAPVGILSDVCTFDRTHDVSITCPLTGGAMSVKVRMIGIRCRKEPTATKPTAGGCHFDNPAIFQRCVPLFDQKMVQEDLHNKIDVTMVLGEAHNDDKGKAMHNLTTRFYKSDWSIPQYDDPKLVALSTNLFSSLTKEGFEPMRRGGSGGAALPDKDFFDYFARHRGSSPRLTNAVKFIQLGPASWQMVYISPYKEDITLACPPAMSAPRHGGQIRITEKHIQGYEEFFKRFVYIRAITGCLLRAISVDKKINISVVPDAVKNQLLQNKLARDHCPSIPGRFAYLIDACSFTLVAHAVGDHVDTIKGARGCTASERCFIENRALFYSPSDSTGDKNDVSRLRGGAGPGLGVYAIVDHPRRKASGTETASKTAERVGRLTEALRLVEGVEGGILNSRPTH